MTPSVSSPVRSEGSVGPPLTMLGVLLNLQAGIAVSSMHKRPAPDKKESTVKKAAVAPVRSEVLVKDTTCDSTPSWASDHNYNAVKPQQTAAVWPSLLYKCMYHLGEPLDLPPAVWTATTWTCPQLGAGSPGTCASPVPTCCTNSRTCALSNLRCQGR